jgi:hypothetical protein
MEAIIRFFVLYAPLVYLLLAVGLLLVLRSLLRSLKEGRDSVFGLEREMAQRRTNQAIAVLVIILLMGLGELVLSSFLAPGLPASAVLTTPTLSLLSVPTNTLSPELMATMSAETPVATPGTEASGCIPGQIMLTFPESASEVRGQITLKGTADIPNFGFYKYEVAPLSSDNWSTIQAGREVVVDGTLGLWDTTELTPGDYMLRLVVTDNQGQALPPCVVTVRVVGQ